MGYNSNDLSISSNSLRAARYVNSEAFHAKSETDESFLVKMTLDTTQGGGDIVLKVHKDWAPLAASRFKDLVGSAFYDGAKFYHVIKDQVAQVGLPSRPFVMSPWENHSLEDEEAIGSNRRGTVSFAAPEGSKNARNTEIVFNLADNGGKSAPFAEVLQGLEHIDTVYSGYGEASILGDGSDGRGPSARRLRREGNRYLDRIFPHLSSIVEAKLL